MAQPGLLEWAHSIRSTMATDPGRQFFQDQIQQHGFLFLDNYLENILAGARQDPIIELVKTPGRKKAVLKKAKAATSRLNNLVVLSLEDSDGSKENVAPVNNFYKTLLQAKDPTDDGASHISHLQSYGEKSERPIPQPPVLVRVERPQPSEIREDLAVHETVSSPALAIPSHLPEPEVEPYDSHPIQTIDTLAPTHLEQNELSVIAEGDESTERSRVSIQLPGYEPSSNLSVVCATPPHARVIGHTLDNQDDYEVNDVNDRRDATPMDIEHDDSTQGMNPTTSSPADRSYSTPLGPSQPLSRISTPIETLAPLPERLYSPAVSEPEAPKVSQRTAQPSSETYIAPLPEIPPWNPRGLDQHSTMSASVLPPTSSTSVLPALDIDVPIRDEAPASPIKSLTRKVSVTLFPTLPAPLPLRKSIRALRDPSMGVSAMMGVATPGAPVGGKRTSWLMKAREVKAMEEIGKKTSTVLSTAVGAEAGNSNMPVSGMLTGTKRKSGDMLGIPGMLDMDDEDRRHKAAKSIEGDFGLFKPKTNDSRKGKERDLDEHLTEARFQYSQASHPLLQPQHENLVPTKGDDQVSPIRDEQEGMLDRFKRTVEGLGARVGKSMGKSLGGAAAANALAEARAAAEARVAERERDREGMTIAMGTATVAAAPAITTTGVTPGQTPGLRSTAEDSKAVESLVAPRLSGTVGRRLSVSDLIAVDDGKSKKEPDKVFQLAPPPTAAAPQPSFVNESHIGDESTTTTPPNSPPPTRQTSFVLPSGPVFNKPPPVFVPPAPAPAPAAPADRYARTEATAKVISSFNLAPSTTSSMFAPKSLGLGPPSSSSSAQLQGVPLSAQSTLESVMSDALFDSQPNVPAWMPASQDTEYTSAFDSQSQPLSSQHHERMHEFDEDDSWPIDEKLAAGAQWTFGAGMSKEDSMTWSTLPTESQRADTGSLQRVQSSSEEREESEGRQISRAIPGAFDMEVDDGFENEGLVDDSEFDEMEIGPGKSTVSLVETKMTRSQSQMSMASSASSQSQSHAGFLGQASKLMNSVLGTSKKGKTEVKSLQLAAVAAKKQQEEKDKKAARLKEMENRRQLALTRKAEEDKAKAMEQEKKMKEDGERRKREREEHTDKKPLKGATSKKEEDNTKKRKVFVEIEKKPEIKKPSAKIAKPSLNTSTSTKSSMKPALKQSTALSSSAAYNASQQTVIASTSTNKAAETKSFKPASMATAAKGKGKAPAPKALIQDDDISQPSQIVQTQMAARAKAQLQAAKQQELPEPTVPSESIELPDIDSEYSDSEDEDRARTFDPPDWAQSPELRQALQVQSTINPDDIFGAIRPLRMEELFRTRTSRFRARTSSANWTGTDRLTIEEEQEYARRMGFR